MNKAEAQEILKDTINENGLYRLSDYISWDYGDEEVILDGSFTLKELEAIVWWMNNIKENS